MLGLPAATAVRRLPLTLAGSGLPADCEEASRAEGRESAWVTLPGPYVAGHGTVYDPRRDRVLAIGGDAYPNYQNQNRTWVLSLKGKLRWGGTRHAWADSHAEGRPAAGEVSLRVYDAVGRNVRGLAQGSFAAGLHSIHWDGRDVSGRPAPSGLYFVRLEAGGRAITRKAVLAR